MTGKSANNAPAEKVRMDKWLWAARFYKTRAIAKEAIDGGKVHCDGVRAKPGKDVTLGQEITLRQGYVEKTVAVIGLSQQRKGATEAQGLYEETSQSIEQRKLESEKRRLQPQQLFTDGRPSKRDRRRIHQFKTTGSD
jgi:ribosome-associated heat shock protein Hsp15